MSVHDKPEHRVQQDNRIKQWWADELTDEELDRIASRECTVADVLMQRVRAMSGQPRSCA